MTHYSSKHGSVKRSQAELYMAFTDMANFTRFVPEDKRADVTADYDSISFKAQGVAIGGRVVKREPYSYIEIKGEGAPFDFTVGLHFDAIPSGTEFYIEVDADLNFMMKMMLGSKLQEALDKVVDGLVDVSEGRMPAAMPQDLKDKYGFN